MTGILKVIPAWLEMLADRQGGTTAGIKSAINAANGLSESVSKTHGSYTSNFNTGLQQYEMTRASAGTGLEGVASGLAQALSKASQAYQNGDSFGKGLLDKLANF